MSGVHIVCFASCYGIALALEFTRLLFRSRWRGLALAGFAAAGLLAHTIYPLLPRITTTASRCRAIKTGAS